MLSGFNVYIKGRKINNYWFLIVFYADRVIFTLILIFVIHLAESGNTSLKAGTGLAFRCSLPTAKG